MDGAEFDTGCLPAELETRVRSELRDGERVLWVGHPRPGRYARQALPHVFFGIPWTAFTIFWMVHASGLLSGRVKGVDDLSSFRVIFFSMYGLPFVLMGLGMLSSPYWLGRAAKRTCYAVTDRRAILWEADWSGSVEVRSYSPTDLMSIRRVEHPDGGGDLVLEEVVTIGSYKGRARTRITRHGFMAIDCVREVEELLRNALLPANGGSPPT